MTLANPVLTYILFAAACFLTGFSKAGFGGMMGPFITLLMAFVLPLQSSIGILLPVLMFGDIFAITAHWKEWDSRLLKLLLPGAVVGVTIGTFFIKNVSPLILRRTLGVIVLIFVVYRLFEGRLQRKVKLQPGAWLASLAGTTAGFTSSLAHSGSPPVSMYLLTRNLQPVTFVGTMALFFTVLNWIKVPYYHFAGLFDWALLWRFAWLAPFVPLGVLVGKWAARRLSKENFDRLILALLVVSAGFLLFQ